MFTNFIHYYWFIFTIDINECSLFPNICQHGSCENLDRGYKCLCDPGYVNDRTGRECRGEDHSNKLRKSQSIFTVYIILFYCSHKSRKC